MLIQPQARSMMLSGGNKTNYWTVLLAQLINVLINQNLFRQASPQLRHTDFVEFDQEGA